ncbi:MAG TPA: flagellar hook-basal body complex protein [candidate division Zixibacteria bacterium]|nr:flagellar hook-basal body complex protein [candidate division Zixibacteria bacterium]
MMASLFAGVSGLTNHQVKMNVIGNNIANINTIGYKGSRVNFQEALVQTYRGAGRPTSVSGGTNPVQLGLGMQVASIDSVFEQGGLETTGQITDLAIQGSGFFILGDNNDNRYYTRAGAFGFDADSNLVDPSSGLYVLGKMADSSGRIPSLATIDRITLPFGQQDPARATEMITLANNLDATATDSDASLISAGSSNVIAVTGTAEDGVGGTHTISITGAQALQASYSGARQGLASTSTLGDLGVTDFTGFNITIDNSRTESITGLTADSTVSDLISAIDEIAGVSCELDSNNAIQITRDRAGDPIEYGFESSASAAGNIVDQLFLPAGSPVGTTFTSTGGAASTFVAIDSFQPDQGTGVAAGPVETDLSLVYDETTGMVIGLDDIGGDGISLRTGTDGIEATSAGQELVIDTLPTTHTASLSIYDSQGTKHTISIEFFKSVVSNRWEWTASMTGTESVTAGGSGYVSFNSDGSLESFAYNGGASGITIDPQNGASNMTIQIDAGTVGNFDGLTGFGSGSHTAAIVGQDGYGLGILEEISIDQAGNISGIFSNGITRVLAQIMVADFTNEAGLRKTGNTQYQPTGNSGEALEGVAGETVSATLFSGALESSSVDIAEEFTSMITAQRGFQANARIITTSDEMLDELVNIKR